MNQQDFKRMFAKACKVDNFDFMADLIVQYVGAAMTPPDQAVQQPRTQEIAVQLVKVLQEDDASLGYVGIMEAVADLCSEAWHELLPDTLAEDMTDEDGA